MPASILVKILSANTVQRFAIIMKKWIIGAAVIIVLAAGVYVMYFHRPPTEDILAANRARHTKKSINSENPRVVKKALHGERPPVADGEDGEDYVEEEYDYDEDNEEEGNTGSAKDAQKKWDKWIEKNNYVSIGELHNSCKEGKLQCVYD